MFGKNKPHITMQELCGQGCSQTTDFLSCMVKTRQWQDALKASKTDSRPWKAYYRVLGRLDLQRRSSNKDPGLQQKFHEWLEECLEYQPLWVYGGDVWTILSNINKHLQHVPSPESGLKPWQDSFLEEEPLQSQWDSTQPDVPDAAASLPPTVDSHGGNTYPVLPSAAAAGQAFATDAAGQAFSIDAAGQLFSTEELGPADPEGLDNFLATFGTSPPSLPDVQQHGIAEQSQPFNQQPGAEFDAALPSLASDQLEIRQAAGSALQLHGTDEQVQQCNHLSSLCLAILQRLLSATRSALPK